MCIANGAAFITFLGSYNIFISPICGVSDTFLYMLTLPYTHRSLTSDNQIIIVDYFFIKKGNIHTPSLFDPSPGSLYYYTKGWNLKALACWIIGAVFGIPGLVGAYHPTWVAEAATHMTQTGWILCFAVAVTFYIASCVILPPKVFPAGHESTAKKGFEWLGETEGYFDGESYVETFGIVEGQEESDSQVSRDDITHVGNDTKV